MSVTIEGIFREILKTFVDDPLKTPFKSPVIVEADKFILIIFIVSPRHFGFQMSVTIRRSN